MNAKITIISVRKNTDPLISQLESVYIKRLKGKCSVRLVDIRPVYQSDINIESVMKTEAEKILPHLQGSSVNRIALDPRGKTCSSEVFANLIQKYSKLKGPDIRFVIGGPFGMNEELKNSTDDCISLSSLTFTHEFARLILLEQIFRATAIWSGSGYHK